MLVIDVTLTNQPPTSPPPPPPLAFSFRRYLSQQIVPPVSRLCEPIEGTSMAVLAEKMGLDASKFTSHVSTGVP